MKFWKLALCASAATFGLASAALADTAAAPPAPTGPTIAWNAGVTTDYLFRGLDQSAGGVAAFGGADLTYGKVYLGTWVSHVDFSGDYHNGNKTLAEVDVYGGVRPTVGPVNLDLGVIGYIYPKQPSGSAENYVEFKALGSITAGAFTPGVAVYYSPDNSFATGHETYLEGNLAYAFKNKATVSAAVGHEFLDSAKDGGLSGYTLWNIGVTYPVTDHLSADLRYYGTSSAAKNFFTEDKGVPFNAADRVVGTLKVTW
ncbi:MAG TPA: TorF family putative porin [Caulobacteraceae bacterium]